MGSGCTSKASQLQQVPCTQSSNQAKGPVSHGLRTCAKRSISAVIVRKTLERSGQATSVATLFDTLLLPQMKFRKSPYMAPLYGAYVTEEPSLGQLPGSYVPDHVRRSCTCRTCALLAEPIASAWVSRRDEKHAACSMVKCLSCPSIAVSIIRAYLLALSLALLCVRRSGSQAQSGIDGPPSPIPEGLSQGVCTAESLSSFCVPEEAPALGPRAADSQESPVVTTAGSQNVFDPSGAAAAPPLIHPVGAPPEGVLSGTDIAQESSEGRAQPGETVSAL